uniref:Uncharacterized protein n=1 Tax=Candidatus Kentrum sp. FW TaxID=2126338 RepID=A0A450T3S1_9GAMM|nr:MAG: hypothetical protein BECKFW1821B_GA0114236_10624 [Candidatus Kentron sp. FW]
MKQSALTEKDIRRAEFLTEPIWIYVNFSALTHYVLQR